MSHSIRRLFIAILSLGLCAASQTPSKQMILAGDANADKSLIKTDPPEVLAKRLQWFNDARFGLFIHWGIYAQDGSYWHGQDGKSVQMMRILRIPLAEYSQIANDFNPIKFNADEWVQTAKDAGMKYIVITSKHHDGFAMYDSKSSDYNIVARTPFKRDPIKELAEATVKQGLHFGVYYSLGRDWQDPDVPTTNGERSNTWDYPNEDKKDFSKYFERKVKPQVKELLTQYPISILWMDTPGYITKEQSEELVKLARSIRPNIVINQRIGNRLGDYRVAEQEIPEHGYSDAWEACMTLNNHWGYHKDDQNWKSTETVVRDLIDIASKNGNLLLNVGPTGQGIIPEGSVARLKEVGQWLKVNGEGIYGTSGSPLPKLDWGRCTEKATAKGTKLYLHVYDWPKDGKLLVPGVKNPVLSAALLANGEKLKTASTPEGVVITLPSATPDKISATVVLNVKGKVSGK